MMRKVPKQGNTDKSMPIPTMSTNTFNTPRPPGHLKKHNSRAFNEARIDSIEEHEKLNTSFQNSVKLPGQHPAAK